MLFGVISVIKMVLHSERIILLSMFYKAYLNVYYFYYSTVSWLDYNSLLSLSSPPIRFEFGIQNPINKSLQRTTKVLFRMRIRAV